MKAQFLSVISLNNTTTNKREYIAIDVKLQSNAVSSMMVILTEIANQYNLVHDLLLDHNKITAKDIVILNLTKLK